MLYICTHIHTHDRMGETLKFIEQSAYSTKQTMQCNHSTDGAGAGAGTGLLLAMNNMCALLHAVQCSGEATSIDNALNRWKCINQAASRLEFKVYVSARRHDD